MEITLPLFIKKLRPEAIIPVKGSALAAGYDLFASESTVIPAKGKGPVKTGLAIHVPQGTYGRVAPRSGLAAKKFIDTGAGVIDEDYRGEEDFQISSGDRIAQLIIERIAQTEIIETENLDDTERGIGGFGSTGMTEIGPSIYFNEEKRKLSDIGNNQNLVNPRWKEFLTIEFLAFLKDSNLTTEDKQDLLGKLFAKEGFAEKLFSDYIESKDEKTLKTGFALIK